MPYLHTPQELRDVLKSARVVAIMGLSAKPDQASYSVGRYLHSAGYTIYPVNPTISEWEGLKSYSTLADIPEKVDIVDVFRGAQHLPRIIEEAIAVGAKTVWAQLGIENPDAKTLAETNDINLVMNRCMKIEHMKMQALG
ncbi:MAG: CoA-binding protein [Anaerolineae bacterium]|nr:CoA-binding protein [Anaerolineae bacterium]